MPEKKHSHRAANTKHQKNSLQNTNYNHSSRAGKSTSSPKPKFYSDGLLTGKRSQLSKNLLNSKTSSVPSWLRDSGIAAWSIIGITIVIAAIVFGTVKILPVFIALFVALVLTALLTPIVNFLDKWLNRWLAVTITLLASLSILVGLISFVIASVAGQWPTLTSQFGDGLDKILEFLDSTPFNPDISAEEILQWVNHIFQYIIDYVQNNWSTVASEALSNVTGVGLFFTIVALSIFVTIFLLGSGARMWVWFLNLLPHRIRHSTHRAASAGWESFSGYSRGTLIIAFIDGILSWVFLQIIGVPLAPALGVLVMIGALIPMFGAPLAMVVAMVVALAANGFVKAAIVGVGIALIGQLEGHVLQPLIMGRQASLHPVVVGVGVTAGTLVAGLFGAIVAIPIIGVIWAVFTELYQPDPPLESLPASTKPVEPPRFPAQRLGKRKSAPTKPKDLESKASK